MKSSGAGGAGLLFGGGGLLVGWLIGGFLAFGIGLAVGLAAFPYLAVETMVTILKTAPIQALKNLIQAATQLLNPTS